MAKRSEPEFPGIPVARVNFWTSANGRRLLVHAGEAWAADDPVVRVSPENFEPLRIHSSKGTSVEYVPADTSTPRHEAQTATA